MKSEQTIHPQYQVYTAYAIGRTEEWLRGYCESNGLPFTQIANGVATALAATGNRAEVHMPGMRDEAARASEILQPKVALASSPRKHQTQPVRPDTSHTSQSSHISHKHNKRKKKVTVTPALVQSIRELAVKGMPYSKIADVLGIGHSTVYRHVR